MFIDLLPHYLSALAIGFFGSVHCLGMCGGIAAALGFAVNSASPGYRLGLLLSYNLGRIASYALLGAMVGGLLGGYQPTGGLNLPRLVAGGLLIAMGLYLAGWWYGLRWLEKAGGLLWRRLQPLSRALVPVDNLGKALLLGALWGWLPCGLVYSALAFSGAQAGWSAGALTMLAFGLGTLPAMLASGIFAERLRQWVQVRGLRQLVGLAVMVFGAWTLVGASGLGHTHSPSQSDPHHQHNLTLPAPG